MSENITEEEIKKHTEELCQKNEVIIESYRDEIGYHRTEIKRLQKAMNLIQNCNDKWKELDA